MTERERQSLKQQLMFCHAENKKSESPIQMIITGISDDLSTKISEVSLGNWPVEMHRETYINIFEIEKLVYLTADAEEVIDDFEAEKIYIIGGLVDHNRLKMVTLDKANNQGIKTAKLPLHKFPDVKVDWSKVLTINHVFSLILKFVDSRDWPAAIEGSLPTRKKQKIEAVSNE